MAFISGGAGNLGRAVTRAFLEAGWRAAVALHHTDAKGALDPLQAEKLQQLGGLGVDLGIADLAVAADDRCQLVLLKSAS